MVHLVSWRRFHQRPHCTQRPQRYERCLDEMVQWFLGGVGADCIAARQNHARWYTLAILDNAPSPQQGIRHHLSSFIGSLVIVHC